MDYGCRVKIAKEGVFCVKLLLVAPLGKVCKHPLRSLKRNLILALEILIYASVNCDFSGFASLENSLLNQFLSYIGNKKDCRKDSLFYYLIRKKKYFIFALLSFIFLSPIFRILSASHLYPRDSRLVFAMPDLWSAGESL